MILALQDHTAGLTVFEKTQAAQLILSRICEAYGRMLLLQGLFQADCHPGNILVMKGTVLYTCKVSITVSAFCTLSTLISVVHIDTDLRLHY